MTKSLLQGRLDAAEHSDRARTQVRVLGDMYAQGAFPTLVPDELTGGAELELNLLNTDGTPALRNDEVLAEAGEGHVVEVVKWNTECNADKEDLRGDGAVRLVDNVTAMLDVQRTIGGRLGIDVVSIGIVPTIRPQHFLGPILSDHPRYPVVNAAVQAMRGGGAYTFPYEGRSYEFPNMGAEGDATALQWHIVVPPERFGAYWRAAQTLAAVQMAMQANGPFPYGIEPAAATQMAAGGQGRIRQDNRFPVIKHTMETRTPQQRAAGRPARAGLGSFAASLPELLEYYIDNFSPSAAPELFGANDAAEVWASGGLPHLLELQGLIGCTWHANRLVIGGLKPEEQAAGVPLHLRIENRVGSSPPTKADLRADGIFFFAALSALAEDPEFLAHPDCNESVVEANFGIAQVRGIETELWWPGKGNIAVTKLVTSDLLERARTGLELLGIDSTAAGPHLDAYGARAEAGMNGARFQTETYLGRRAEGQDHDTALTSTYLEYRDAQLAADESGSDVSSLRVARPRTIIDMQARGADPQPVPQRDLAIRVTVDSPTPAGSRSAGPGHSTVAPRPTGVGPLHTRAPGSPS